MPSRLALGFLMVASLTGCPREAPVGIDGGAAPDVPATDTSPERPDTGIPGCDFAWDPSSSIVISPSMRAFELDGACVGDRLVAAWRADGTLSAAWRALAPGASWQPLHEPVTTDATALGDVVASDGAAWMTWQSALGWLRMARLDPDRTRASGPIAIVGVTLSDPHLLVASGDRALIAATARTREASFAAILPLGLVSAPPLTGYAFGQGTLVAAAGGSTAFVAWVTTPASHSAVLHAARIDSARALAMDAPRRFDPLPDGVFLSRAETEIGGGAFEFAPVPAPLAGAVFFQPVATSGRGNARVALFPQNGSVSVGMLDDAPSVLGHVLDGIHLGDVSLRYWDAASTLVSREIVGGNLAAPRPVAMPLASPIDASLGTREVTCGGRRWVIFVLHAAGANRLYAEPAACVLR